MTDPTRGQLSEAVLRYIEAAIPIVTADLQPGELIGLPGGGRWKATGPAQFQRDQAPRLSWVMAIHRREEQLHALPQFQAVDAVIQVNEEWRAQFGTLVGTRYSRMRLDLDWFLSACLGDALSAFAEGHDPGAAATDRVATMERFLEASSLTVEIFGPLMGFSAADVGRIEFAPGIALEPIDVTEVESLVSVGLLTPTMPDFPFVNAPTHMVRATYRIPKVVGSVVDVPDPQVFLDESKPAEEAIEDLVVCLRLLKPGIVALSGTAKLMPSYVGRSWSTTPGGRALAPHFHSSYGLSVDELPMLTQIWDQLHSRGARLTEHLMLAARRYAYKGERSRLDDQLVDLMVAAEALFLGEGDEDSRGELRFRLSSRAASYIKHPSRDKKWIHRLFMRAYRMRSRLVHGGVAEPIALDGEELTPEKMVENVESLLRIALKQALGEASQRSRRWTVDWESLLFPTETAADELATERPTE
jgi:hypothetical protein